VEKSQIKRIELNTAGKAAYMEKGGEKYQSSLPIGQAQINAYLEGLSQLRSKHFADSLPAGHKPASHMLLATEDKDTLSLEAYRTESPGRWLIHCPQMNSTWLSTPSENLYAKIFSIID
jgi:hypothetical protein